MGSRAENDNYQMNLSDIDCCAVVSQPVPYRELFDIVGRAILETSKLELCPRTILQLKIKNKFNYDLRYLSRIIYLRDLDVRMEIPEITLADFSRRDICSTLFSALGLFFEALNEYFKKSEVLIIVSLLEKSLRKISLYLNLRNSVYPVDKTNRYNILNTLYFEQSLHLSELKLFRQSLNFTKVKINKSILALIFIIKSELNLMFNCADIDFLGEELFDKEHTIFAQTLLAIFFKICEITYKISNSNNILFLNQIKSLLINDYSLLINEDTFSPPIIINGGYHVFK